MNPDAASMNLGRALEAIETARVSLASARSYLLCMPLLNKDGKQALDLINSALGESSSASKQLWYNWSARTMKK